MAIDRMVLQTSVRLHEALRVEALAREQGLTVYAYLQRVIRAKLAEEGMREMQEAAKSA